MYQCLLGGQSDFKVSLTIRKQAVKVETRLICHFGTARIDFPIGYLGLLKVNILKYLWDQKSSEKIYLFVRKEYSQYTF